MLAMAELRLTQREREILVLVANGAANKQIADKLHCSPRTVETHLSRLFLRSGARSRAELVHIVQSCGDHLREITD